MLPLYSVSFRFWKMKIEYLHMPFYVLFFFPGIIYQYFGRSIF